MSQYRDRENGKYLVRLERISSVFPSNDMLVDCKLVNKKIEEAILFAPEQYWWLHRRFKTRPSEEPSLY
jgi:lauroyl/myristoyl acyltransferase